MKSGNLLKRTLGRALERTAGKLQYENCIFILAHMRCGSTALSNIICSRPDVNGYGEAHVRHDGPGALGQLAMNQMRRDGWSRQARFAFDKILHTRLDRSAPEAFFRARAIFVIREPEPAVRSICNLYEKMGRRQYRTEEAAAGYYVERLDALAQLWDRFPADKRIGLTHAGLLRDPDKALATISSHLQFEPPLKNRYKSLSASRRGGGGDPLVSGQYDRIEPDLGQSEKAATPLDVDASLLRRARDSHDAMRERIARDWPELI